MFGDKLKFILDSKNITQIQLAKELNMTQQAINRWCQNITQPDINTIIKIAKYLDVSIDYLLGNDTNCTAKEKEIREKEILQKILIESGYMKKGEDISNDELKRLMDFVNTNKNYIKGNK
mgnify:CR=1 FL=1